MQQKKNILENGSQHALGLPPLVLITAVQCELAHLDVPVAELVPGKLVQMMRELVEAMALDRFPRLRDRRREAGEDRGAVDVARGAPHGLDQRALRAEEP